MRHSSTFRGPFRFCLTVILASTGLADAEMPLDPGHRILLEHENCVAGRCGHAAEVEDWRTLAGLAANLPLSGGTLVEHPTGLPWARCLTGDLDQPAGGAQGPVLGMVLEVQCGTDAIELDSETAAGMTRLDRSLLERNLFALLVKGPVPSPAGLEQVISQARANILIGSDPATNKTDPDHPARWLSILLQYRRAALAKGIPYGLDLRNAPAAGGVSEPEWRMRYFLPLALGYKVFLDDAGFELAAMNLSGPTAGEPPLDEAGLKQAQQRIRLLARSLARLVSTEVCIVHGDTPDARRTRAATSRNGSEVPVWRPGIGDARLKEVEVKPLGSQTNNTGGDVLLSWFKVLHESMDGPAHAGQVYFMVTNTLTAPGSSAADCRQEVNLVFDFGADAPSAVQRLRQEGGQVESLEWPNEPRGGGKRRIVLVLDGGTGELFKFKTGAPFVGAELSPSAASRPVEPNPLEILGIDEDLDLEQTDFAGTSQRPVVGAATRPTTTRPTGSQPSFDSEEGGGFSPCSSNELAPPGC